jgi:hypothetical protein
MALHTQAHGANFYKPLRLGYAQGLPRVESRRVGRLLVLALKP